MQVYRHPLYVALNILQVARGQRKIDERYESFITIVLAKQLIFVTWFFLLFCSRRSVSYIYFSVFNDLPSARYFENTYKISQQQI